MMPVGRDAVAVADLVEKVGLRPIICDNAQQLLDNLECVVDVVLLTEEALSRRCVDMLEEWVNRQPPWSDQPFIVMASQNVGSRLAAFRREVAKRLRNVGFLERPMQGFTIQATVIAAQRARTRQYETRAHLEDQQGAAKELERLVAERTLELERANRLLREEIAERERAQAALLQAQKIEALGQLVGGVAHDFNNLLMAITGNLDLLSKRVGEDARLKRLVNGAMEGARRGAGLTQRLLAFARKQELKAEATDIQTLVTGMMDFIDRSVGPLVRVDLKSDEQLPAINIDPNQLELALLNLALNARDAMLSGGVLTIELSLNYAHGGDQPDVSPGEYVVLSVKDTGTGMDTETLAKAVEPFFSTKGVGKGTGLGLSMVFGLAQQSGGALRLESSLGKGTTVRLWLPVATNATPAACLGFPTPANTARARILFVDDDLLTAASTVSLLEDLGHDVTEAHSAREALQLLEGGLVADLLITDHAMPDMTGSELAHEVRRRSPSLPVLLATAFAELEGDDVAALPRLSKPYTQDQLSRAIASLVPALPEG
ncbi:His Kinase A (phospho-acceptor) domain-containing protein [Bradyrhizobium sp. NFR13]|uniref:ATP-binding protein n=1 Tax=Bradyrhizobium sp. NFR13 TaxID=1566285 RepID=UPI0008E44A7E|nr:ATP-binding protein [Bradyrhizobium sp. NFR13]SFM03391.1 His Kinase A (phospho-acceptor) domain-containing protein [Bradyrhizobium sp. NFR13]